MKPDPSCKRCDGTGEVGGDYGLTPSHCDCRYPKRAISAVETGWLIEHEDEPKWLTLKPGEAAYEVCWTKESTEALRFARRVDADDYASTFMDEGPVRITEHAWG